MVGLVFGIIFILAGIGVGSYFYSCSETAWAEDNNGRYLYDENNNHVKITKHPLRKFTTLVVLCGVLLGVVLTGLGCISSVDTGYVGIVKTFGRVENYTFDSGFHFKAPWNSVVQIDNRVQKTTNELPCFSSDIQEVYTVYTVNYQISKTNAQNLYRDVGTNYLETVVNPTIQESVKTVVAKYTAEQLIGKREVLAEEIESLLAINLQKYNIDVVSTAIENMDFTESFTAAVEAKAVAAQQKLQAQIEQERLTMEAVQAAERAQIEAEAQAVVDKTKAEAAKEISEIQAEADRIVAQIGSDSAEYQGKKEAAIALQRLASINGWTVIHNEESGINELYKANGEKVTDEELAVGSQKLIEYYYTQTWDGKLPDTFVGDGDVSNIIIGK
jgi:regulator of protease activity HflC (stomatin/prohibitin superfamily)